MFNSFNSKTITELSRPNYHTLATRAAGSLQKTPTWGGFSHGKVRGGACFTLGQQYIACRTINATTMILAKDMNAFTLIYYEHSLFAQHRG